MYERDVLSTGSNSKKEVAEDIVLVCAGVTRYGEKVS